MGLDWELAKHCKTKEFRWDSTSLLASYPVLFLGDAKPWLYAFQYIYCNYFKNLKTDLRATTQFGLLCPLLLEKPLINKVDPVSQIKTQELLDPCETMQWRRANDCCIV